jgi:G3E family GTPase
LLRDPRLANTAVAVNEFGDVPLDAGLLDHGGEQTLMLANGCLCCTLSGDLDTAILRLFSRRESGALPHFARLIIEPSGLADPAPIAQAILRNPVLARALRLDAIVTVADALFLRQQLGRQDTARKQIALADRLVLAKPDLAGEAGVQAAHAALRDLNPVAPILVARHGAVDAAALLPPQFLDPQGAAPARRRSALFAEAVDTDHLAAVTAVRLSATGPLRWRPVEAWLRRLRLGHGERLLRLKALLHLADAAGPVLVQGVHHVLHDPVELGGWDGEAPHSRLLLVIEGDTAEAIRQSWQAALPDLRAPGGD